MCVARKCDVVVVVAAMSATVPPSQFFRFPALLSSSACPLSSNIQSSRFPKSNHNSSLYRKEGNNVCRGLQLFDISSVVSRAFCSRLVVRSASIPD